MLRVLTAPRLAFVVVLAATGCATLIGFPDYGTGGSSGTGGAGSGGATASSGKTSSTGTAGNGGGATGGSAPACQEGAPCYFGLDGTEGVGLCKGGTVSCEGGVAGCDDVRPALQSCVAPQSDANCDGLLHCTGDFRWARTGYQSVMTNLAAGADGTVAVVGTLNTPIAAGNALALTFDARGRQCWPGPTYFGGAGVLNPIGVAVDGVKVTPDGRLAQASCAAGGAGLAASTIVVGEATGDVDFGKGAQPSAGGTDAFIALLGPTGKVSWGLLFGSPGADRAAAATAGPDGAIYVTGYVEGPAGSLGCPSVLDGGTAGDPTTFVAKLGPDGTCAWLKPYTGNVAGTGIALGKDGTSVVVIGRFFGTVDFGGGVTVPSGANMNNTFVVRVSTADGSIVGTPASIDVPNTTDPSVAVGQDDSVFVAGSFSGTFGACSGPIQQGYLAPLTPALAPAVTAICYSGSAVVGGYGVAVDADANVVIGLAANGAAIQSSGAGFPKAIPAAGFTVVKLASPYADYLWSFAAVPSMAGYGSGLGVDAMGDVVVTANTNMAFNLGGQSVGGQNISFVLGLAP